MIKKDLSKRSVKILSAKSKYLLWEMMLALGTKSPLISSSRQSRRLSFSSVILSGKLGRTYVIGKGV